MKNLRIRLPSVNHLKVSCPHSTTDHQIIQFLEHHEDWIAENNIRIAATPTAHFESIQNNEFYLWGEQQQINEPHISESLLQNRVESRLRLELKQYVASSLDYWQNTMGVKSHSCSIRKMRTKWGSCNVSKARIWLNLRLAHYPKICVEMVLVHELAHLIEASHNKRFYGIMDTYIPEWRKADNILNPIKNMQNRDKN